MLELSRAEHRVMRQLLEGKSNEEIAHALAIHLSTVKTHLELP
jgi:DNA-binding CsgD family transcriptional regulator